MLGIDLSHNQNVTSYPALRNSADFFYMKISQCDNFIDPAWRTHHQYLQGKMRAPYHFMGVPRNWAGQVSRFVAQYSQVSWEWPPVLDAEPLSTGGGAISCQGSWIKAWIDEWRRQTGQRLIYVYLGYADANGAAPLSSFVDDDVRVIIARYYSPNRGDAWTSARLHSLLNHPNVDITQYWDKGNVPGCSNWVDLNDSRRIVTAAGANDQEDDLTPEQDQKLTAAVTALGDIREQLCGQGARTTGYPGWASEVDPSKKLSLVDFVRAIDGHVAGVGNTLSGKSQSHIDGDKNTTNMHDLAFDTGAWVNATMGKVNDLETKVAGLDTKLNLILTHLGVSA